MQVAQAQPRRHRRYSYRSSDVRIFEEKLQTPAGNECGSNKGTETWIGKLGFAARVLVPR